MQSPLRVSFRGLAPSAGVESHARELAQRLQKINSRITACRITVQSEIDDRSREAQYSANIHLSLPGTLIRAGSPMRLDVSVALRSAFEDARRQLDSLQPSSILGSRRSR